MLSKVSTFLVSLLTFCSLLLGCSGRIRSRLDVAPLNVTVASWQCGAEDVTIEIEWHGYAGFGVAKVRAAATETCDNLSNARDFASLRPS